MSEGPKQPNLEVGTQWSEFTIPEIQSLIVSEHYEEALRQAKLRKAELERLLEETPLESSDEYTQEEWDAQRQGLVEEISELFTLIQAIETEISND